MPDLRAAWAKKQQDREIDQPMGQSIERGEHTKIRKKLMAENKLLKTKYKLTAAREHREIQELARRGTEAAMRRLIDIVMSPAATDANAIQAARELFERGYGKSVQTNVNAHIDANGKPSEVTASELDTRIATVLRRVEEIAGGTPEPVASEERPADLRKLN